MSCDRRCFDKDNKWYGYNECEKCPGADRYIPPTIAQQPLSGSEQSSSPKCLNKGCDYYNEKFDMNCDANEDLCEKCLGTSDNRKRWATFRF